MKSLKRMGMMALAMLALGNSASATVFRLGNQANKEMIQGKEAGKKRKDSLPDMIGGVNMIFRGGDGGRPPHIYGMFHVRRGTHKRTNC